VSKGFYNTAPGPSDVRLADHAARDQRTGGAPVAAYALSRPDATLAILLLNKDPRRPRAVSIALAGESAGRASAAPPVSSHQRGIDLAAGEVIRQTTTSLVRCATKWLLV